MTPTTTRTRYASCRTCHRETTHTEFLDHRSCHLCGTKANVLSSQARTILELAFAVQSARPPRRVSYYELGFSEPAFWRTVDSLLDTPAAASTFPTDVARLLRLREARRAARSA